MKLGRVLAIIALLCTSVACPAQVEQTFAALGAQNVFTATPNTFLGIVATSVTDSGLTSGNCVQAGTGGILLTVSGPCGGSGSGVNITVNGGSNLTSPVNFQNGSAVTGITINASNPSGSNVAFNISGLLTSVGLANTAVTAGPYTCANITVNAEGQLTSAANGSCGGGGGTVTGTGTSGTIPLWTSSSAIGNSVILQSGAGPYGLNLGTIGTSGIFVEMLEYGPYTNFTQYNDTAHVCGLSTCNGIAATNNYSGAGLTNQIGMNVAVNNTSSGTTSNELGAQIISTLTSGTSTSTVGAIVSSQSDNSTTTTTLAGIEVTSYGLGTVTKNKAIDVTSGAFGSTVGSAHLTNDYSIFIESIPSSGDINVANHTGLYIADQGASNTTANTWYAINIAPQTTVTVPTPIIGAGGVNIFAGSGAPTINCGTTPSLYLNSSSASASTAMYSCNSGTSWTAFSGGGGSLTGSSLASTQVTVATSSTNITSYTGFTSDSSGNVALNSIAVGGSSGLAGLLGLGGNTSNPVLPTNAAGYLGPSSASFTSYFCQFPSASPAGSQFLSCGTPSTNVATGSWINSPQVLYSAGSYTNATTGFTNVTGLSFSALASTNYSLECHLYFQASVTTAGIKAQITGPSSPTNVNIGLHQPLTAGTYNDLVVAAFSSSLGVTTSTTATTTFEATLSMGLINGSNPGTVQVQLAAEGTGTLTLENGSFCRLQ